MQQQHIKTKKSEEKQKIQTLVKMWQEQKQV